jgi:hypothetical protein
MKAVSKLITGAAAAALVSLGVAAPAEARHRDGYRDRGSSVGDIITGIAVLGGIAAVTNALGRDYGRYGSGYGNRYRGGYTAAVNACAYEAERMGRGRVQITDVDRTGNDRFRVRGVVESGYGYDRGGYDRNDRYGRYDNRYDNRYGRYDNRYDNRYGRYDNRYDRYGSYDRRDRDDFTCYARGNGRVIDFNL